MNEYWKDIKGYEGYYQISNLGRVKSLYRKVNFVNGLRDVKERIRKTSHSDKLGYELVTLKNINNSKRFYVHRLVAESFIENKENKRTVNHIDGNKLNNNLSNLEWATDSENLKHAHDIGLKKGYWKDKVIHNSRRVLYIKDCSVIEFNSFSDCSKYIGCSINTVIKNLNKELKGGLIYNYE